MLQTVSLARFHRNMGVASRTDIQRLRLEHAAATMREARRRLVTVPREKRVGARERSVPPLRVLFPVEPGNRISPPRPLSAPRWSRSQEARGFTKKRAGQMHPCRAALVLGVLGATCAFAPFASADGDPVAGNTLFQTHCSGCHDVSNDVFHVSQGSKQSGFHPYGDSDIDDHESRFGSAHADRSPVD